VSIASACFSNSGEASFRDSIDGGQATAKKALALARTLGYEVPSPKGRSNLVKAFAARGCVVYGKAFDCLKVSGNPIDLTNRSDVEQRTKDITLCEIKSTRRALPSDFKGYFCSISTAELLVAQSLGPQFRFLFVNVSSGAHLERSLQEIFANAHRIYPSWSIKF
jgi:hypothetical protein